MTIELDDYERPAPELAPIAHTVVFTWLEAGRTLTLVKLTAVVGCSSYNPNA